MSKPPLDGVRGQDPQKDFLEKCPIKYCNFVVNLDHSLCHIFDGRSYVNIRVFSLEGKPLLYMRELYYGYVLF